ncbi:MAG: hypothetical protein WBA23_14790, partial [Tunicatimonas sp.]|uniref:hypothetical protein n=1 Tax=Tunicatimonas sp. TaxID=1940096 RepID=UPI003C77FF27
RSIHEKVKASEARISSFITTLQRLSMSRAFAYQDKLNTLKLYAGLRNVSLPGRVTATAAEFEDGGSFEGTVVDNDAILGRATDYQQSANDAANAWRNDPEDDRAQMTSAQNIFNDPPPPHPATGERLYSIYGIEDELRVWRELYEAWQHKHASDLNVLSEEQMEYVLHAKPLGIKDDEWMDIITHKIEKGQF